MKNIIQRIQFLLLVSILGCSMNIAGNVDETDTSIAGFVSYSGQPVPGATVKIYNYRDTLGEAIDSMITDNDGNYDVSGIENGVYSVWAETDSSVFFRDSVNITNSYVTTDTLVMPRVIRIPIKVEEQHDPRIVEAHILGTHIYPVVDEGSHLTLVKIPSATFPIRLTTSNSDYTPRTWDVVITADSPDTLKDTLDMTYTGVPVVTGIEAVYDTLSGVATIQWDRTAFNRFSRYEIYRDRENAPSLSTDPIASVTETFCLDTLSHNISGGQELATGRYIYRVKIRSLDERVGISFHTASIDFVDPKEAVNLLPDTTLTMSLHRAQSIPLTVPGWLGDTVTGEYRYDGKTGVIDNPELFDLSITDGYHRSSAFVVTLNGSNGRSLTDSIDLEVIGEWRKLAVSPGFDGHYTTPVEMNGVVYTTVHQPNGLLLLSSADSCKSWSELNSSVVTSYDSSRASNVIVFQDRLWIIDGNGELFSSISGVSWSKESTSLVVPTWGGDFEDRILAVRNGTIELAVENTSSREDGGTQFTFWIYDLTDQQFVSTMTKNSQRLFLDHYWLEMSDQGFRIYGVRDLSDDRSIARYSVGDESVVAEDTLIQSAPNGGTNRIGSEQLRHSLVNYHGGVYLADGIDQNQPLFVENPLQWGSSIEKNIFPVGSVTGVRQEMNLFVLNEQLYSVTSEGVFCDF